MLLLPEDIYNELMIKSPITTSSGIIKPPPPLGGDQQLIGQTRERLSKLGSSLNRAGKNDKKRGRRVSDVDSKEIQYNREFKRYSKLLKDQADKPVNVKMVESSIASAASAAIPTSNPAAAAAEAAVSTQKRRQPRRRKTAAAVAAKLDDDILQSSSINENGSSSTMSSTEDDDEVAKQPSNVAKALGTRQQESKKDTRPKRENRSQRNQPYIPNYYPDKYSSAAATASTSNRKQKGKGIEDSSRCSRNRPNKIIHKNRTRVVSKNIPCIDEHFKPQLWKFYYY
jgi:hypothetical protein